MEGGVAFDVLLGQHLLNEEMQPVSLKNVASVHLGVGDWGKGKHRFGDDGKPPSDLWGSEGMLTYNMRDTAYSHLLYESLRYRLQDRQSLARLAKYLTLPAVDLYVQMELNGIYMLRDRVDERRAETEARLTGVTASLLALVPETFRQAWAEAEEKERALAERRQREPNLKDPLANDHTLRRWIFGVPPDGMGLTPVSYTPSGLAGVDEESLKQLRGEHPALDLLLERRQLVKNLQFFDQWLEWVGDDGRIHPYFNLNGTVTGRRSCDNPNMQQVPRDRFMRSCFGARPGWLFLEVDFSQVEVRIAAWFAEEEELLRIFREGRDVYRYVTARLLGKAEDEVTKQERQYGKAVVLGFLYGLGARNFMAYAWDMFQVEVTFEQATAFRNGFFALFPALQAWHERQRQTARKRLQVENPFGRVRHLMRVMSVDKEVRAKAERQAINSPVQGMGGDLTLATLLGLREAGLPREEILLVGEVHDSVMFEVRADRWREWAIRALEMMEHPPLLARFGIIPPVRLTGEAKVGQEWGSGDEYTLEALRGDSSAA